MTLTRAIEPTQPTQLTPARAVDPSITSQRSPARAKAAPTPQRDTPARANHRPTSNGRTLARAFPYQTLRDLGGTLADLEQVRVRIENRCRAARDRGSLPASHEEMMLAGIRDAEHAAELDLRRITRRHPLWASFARDIPGVGENLFGRLLAEIGDPLTGSRGHWRKDTLRRTDGSEVARRVWVIDETYERTVSQLWAYCGFDPNRRRIPKSASQAEMMACGNPQARVAAIKIAMQLKRTVGGNTLPHGAVSPRSPYRDIFDVYKETQLARGLTKGHADNRARRYVAKRFLRDLWIASRHRPFVLQDQAAGGNS